MLRPGALTLDDLHATCTPAAQHAASSTPQARAGDPRQRRRSCATPPKATPPVYGVNTGFGKLAEHAHQPKPTSRRCS